MLTERYDNTQHAHLQQQNKGMDKYQKKLGCFIQIPNVGRGQLRYVGPVDGKQGMFVGVDLLANIGKNNGSFQERQYFHTDYPQSGLFIQLQKVASLIDSAVLASSSRRATLGESSGTNKPNNHSSSSSRPDSRRATLVDPRSPTPVRSRMLARSGELLSDAMDVDPEEVPVVDNAGQSEYEARIQQQQQEIGQYRRLLDDQRIVLEEIQPAIDDYEEKLRDMEAEISQVHRQLAQERESHKKQKSFFEGEQQQLLSVVEQLSDDIKEHERRFSEALQQQQQQPQTQEPTLVDDRFAQENEVLCQENEVLRQENEALRQENEALRQENETTRQELQLLLVFKRDQENARTKWERERDQLKMHNESLNSEYQHLSKELTETQSKLDLQTEQNTLLAKETDTLHQGLEDARNRIAHLELDGLQKQQQQQQEARDVSANASADSPTSTGNAQEQESLPLYTGGPKRDPSAGRPLWCALCERDGHESVECPYETDQLF